MLSYLRKARDGSSVLVVANFTPLPRHLLAASDLPKDAAAVERLLVLLDPRQGAKLALAEAEAVGKHKVGTAEAQVLQARMLAEAEGKEKVGLADVHVRAADAEAVVKQGEAEARKIEVVFGAEAKGLREKFESMKAMSAETRQHEEYRMALERGHVETMKGIDAQTTSRASRPRCWARRWSTRASTSWAARATTSSTCSPGSPSRARSSARAARRR